MRDVLGLSTPLTPFLCPTIDGLTDSGISKFLTGWDIRMKLRESLAFPGSAEHWIPLNPPKWLRNVRWTKAQLKELIRNDFRTLLGNRVDNAFSEQFPADGQTPGGWLAEKVDLMIVNGEIY